MSTRKRLDWPDEQPTLTDGVISLRSWQPEDADAVYRACQDEQIQRFTNVPVPYLLEHAKTFVSTFAPDNWASGSSAGFAVTSVASGVVLAPAD